MINKAHRIFIVVGITALALSYIGLWIRLINNPTERTGADFIHFYSAGRVAQKYGISKVYNLELQQEFEEMQVGFTLAPRQVLPFNHLPYLIPILKGIMSANYVMSFYRWNLLMILFFVLGISILSQVLRQKEFDQKTILTSAIGSILFLPVFVSLQNGQDTAILVLGTAIWVFGLHKNRYMLAGIGLSLITVRPHLALILALPMLFRYKRVFFGFILGSGVLALFSITLLGLNGTKEFIDIIFLTAGGNWYGTHQEAMLNLIGLLMRTLPFEGVIIRLIGWIGYGIAIVALCILWSRKTDLHSGLIGLTVTIAVLAVPHLHFHDLSLLLIPIYELIRSSIEYKHPAKEIAVLLPIAISLLLLASNAAPVLQYTVPYIVMLGLAGYPYYLRDKSPLTTPHPT